ncbi:MAG: TIGR01777 family oxidoreductase [Acidimicrobiales bacterium]
MRVAITGSSGFIGTALRRRLAEGGHELRCLVRRAPTNAEEIEWDPAAGRLDAGDLEGVDAVVNLAGVGIADGRWSAEQKRRLVSSRIDSTNLLARTMTAMDHPPTVLLSGSAIGYYGDHGSEVLNEQSPPGSSFLAQLCRDWEAATGPAEAAGIRVAHLRTGLVLDAKGGALAKMLPLFRLGLGGPFGSGADYWSWITLDDEVGAIEFLLGADVSGPVNLTAPEPVTNKDLTRALANALRRPAVVPVPAFGPRLLLGRELADELLFSSIRVRPQVLLDVNYPFRHRDLADGLAAALTRR